MNSKGLFLAGWFIACSFITYQEISTCHSLPWPPRYIFAALTYGLLDLAGMVIGDLAGVVAIGFTLAIIVNTLNGTSNQKGMLSPFVPSCTFDQNGNPVPHPGGTAQPSSYTFLQGGSVNFVNSLPGATPGQNVSPSQIQAQATAAQSAAAAAGLSPSQLQQLAQSELGYPTIG